MQLMINIQDSITGAWHQVTFETVDGIPQVRVDGNAASADDSVQMQAFRRSVVNVFWTWPHGEVDG